MIPQLFKTKLTAGVIAVTFCSAGVAAAATGGLPGPLQRGLDRAAAVVGHDVPPTTEKAADEMDNDTSTTSSGSTTSTIGATTSTEGSTTSTSGASTTEATSGTSDETTAGTDDMDDAEHDGDMKDTPVGPDATGPAKQGLCNAYLHSVAKGHSKNADAVAFRNLTKAATEAGQTVEEFCGDDVPVDTGTTTASSMPTSSSSMPSSDDDDDDEMTSTSAKAHGKNDSAAPSAKHGKP